MIICKECLEKFKLNILKREVKCPQCDTTIDYGEFRKVKRVKNLLKIFYLIVHCAIVFVALTLHGQLHSRFPWSQRLIIAILLWMIAMAMSKFVLLPMLGRKVAKMYNNHDKKV